MSDDEYEPGKRVSRRKRKEKSQEPSPSSKESDEDSLDVMAPLASRHKLNQGAEHQIEIEEFVEGRSASQEREKETPIWINPTSVDENKLKAYVELARGTFGMPLDRALYILRKSNMNYEEAKKRLSTVRYIRDEWTKEDKILFRRAFHIYGKRFDLIQALMPHRSFRAVINFYYDTKKGKHFKTAIETQMKVLLDTPVTEQDRSDAFRPLKSCENCGNRVRHVTENMSTKRQECNVCITYMNLMGRSRKVNLKQSFMDMKSLNVDFNDRILRFAEKYRWLSKTVSSQSLVQHDQKGPLDTHCLRNTIEHSNLNRPAIMITRREKTNCMVEIEKVLQQISKVKLRVGRVKNPSLKKTEAWSERIRDDMAYFSEIRAKYERVSNSSDEKSTKQRNSHTWTDLEKDQLAICCERFECNPEMIAEVLTTKSQGQIRSQLNGAPELKQIISNRNAQLEERVCQLECREILGEEEVEVVTLDE